MAETIDISQVPPDVQKAFESAPAQPPSAAGVAVAPGAQPVSHYDLPQDVAQKLLSPSQLHDYEDQQKYGKGVGNIVQAGIESGFNQALLGAGDAILVTAGANAEALRQRRERNAISSAIGGAGGFVLPMLLTGGEAGVARAGLEAAEGTATIAGAKLGERAIGEAAGTAAEVTRARTSIDGLRNAVRFTPTPAGAAELGKAVQGFTERALASTPIAGRMAGVVARNAAEGAIYGTGSAISDVVRDGDDVLGDHETAAEYLLYHAVEGGVIGGALGGALEGTAAAVGKAGRKAGEAYKGVREFINADAPVSVEAGASAGRASDAQAKAAEAADTARRATDEASRLDNLPEYVAPKSEAETKKLLEKIVTQQTGDAPAAHAAVEDVAGRLNRLQSAHQGVGRVVDDATVDVTKLLTERTKITDELESKFSIGRKFRKADEAIRNATDVAPIEVVGKEGAEFVANLKADIQEFQNDPDTKVASLSKRLLTFVDQADFNIRKAIVDGQAGSPANRAAQTEVFSALDNLKRSMGFARTRMAANAGDIELRNFPGRLQQHYVTLAANLENAGLYGEKTAAIQAENNAAWTKYLDVANGFEREFLRTGEYGAGKSASGFGSVAQADSSRVGSLLDGLLDPKKGLQLQVFSQGLDTHTALIEQLGNSLKATPEEAALVKRVRDLTGEIGDKLKSVAETHADAAEYRALQGPIGERQAAIDAAAKAQGKAADLSEAARGKAEEAGADLTAKKAEARAAAQDEKANVIRKVITPLATGAVTAGALATGLPWWTVGGAVPLSAVVGQVMSKVSSEKLIAATSAGFRATDRAATAIADAMTSRAGKGATALAKQGPRAAVAYAAQTLGKKDTRQAQFERVKAELETMQQDPGYFARTSPQAMPLTKTPMLQASMVSKRANAIQFLKSKLPAEFKPVVPAPQLDKHPGVDGIQVRRFLRYAQAVNNPQSVLDDAANGVVTPEGFEALRAVYPRLHNQLVTTVFDRLATAEKQPSMQQAQNLSLITGVPMHFTMTPDFVAGYQAIYAQQGQGQPNEGQQPADQSVPASQRARQVTDKTSKMYATATEAAVLRG